MTHSDHYDLIVIGSGAEDASLAHRLAPSGKRIDARARRLLATFAWRITSPRVWGLATVPMRRDESASKKHYVVGHRCVPSFPDRHARVWGAPWIMWTLHAQGITDHENPTFASLGYLEFRLLVRSRGHGRGRGTFCDRAIVGRPTLAGANRIGLDLYRRRCRRPCAPLDRRGSVIIVTGVVFAITIATLAQASSQCGSRLLRNFMHDRGNQVVLGTFVATFLYRLLILRVIRGAEEATFIPHISITFGVLMGIGSLAVPGGVGDLFRGNGMITVSKYWRTWSDPRFIIMVLNNRDLNQKAPDACHHPAAQNMT